MAYPINVLPNFEHNLESIRCFFHQNYNQAHRYERLLEKLFDVIIPNIQSYPLIGMDFLKQPPDTLEAYRKIEGFYKKLPTDTSIRKYNDQEYVILYLFMNDVIHLLAIKHQKQSVFDLRNLF